MNNEPFNATNGFHKHYNGTNTTEEYYAKTTDIGIAVVWGLIILIGVIGNGLVIYIVLRYGERSITNVYITNLAVADLTFIFFVVSATLLHVVLPSWILGDAYCKFSTYMTYVTLHATCLTLTAMTIDRYHALVNPLQSIKWRSTRVSSYVCLAVWAVSLAISLPFLVFHKVDWQPNSDIQDCIPAWPSMAWQKAANVVVVLTTFVIPLIVILICYGFILVHVWKSQDMKLSNVEKTDDCLMSVCNTSQIRQMERMKRVMRMVAILVMLFVVCWLPIQLFTIWMQFDPNFPKTYAMLKFKYFANTLSYANSCVNPFVYAFGNNGIRKTILKRSPVLRKILFMLIEAKPNGSIGKTSRD